MARYFDRAWLIYGGGETGVYADLVTQRNAKEPTVSWHGTLVGAVDWSKLHDDRQELDLRTLAGDTGRFFVARHHERSERAEITGSGPPPF